MPSVFVIGTPYVNVYYTYSIKILMIVDFYELLQMYSPYLPDDEDLSGVVDAILRLQDTYQLPAYQIADGTFTPSRNSPSMTGEQSSTGHHTVSYKV